MALTSIPNTPATQAGTQRAVTAAVRELQRQRTAVLAGAAANTNIAVSGIAADDVVIEALYYVITAGNVTDIRDVTAEIVVAAGNVRVRTTVTTGGRIVLRYIDVA